MNIRKSLLAAIGLILPVVALCGGAGFLDSGIS